MRNRRHRALRIIGGIAGMAAFCAAGLFIVTSFAGSWGIPYFRFTTDNGSPCVNTWTGFTCSSITPDDFELYSREPLPPGTTIRHGSMTITQDYQVSAVLVTTAAQANAAGADLQRRFGSCGSGPTPAELTGAKQVCRMATDDDVAGANAPADRTYTITTGVVRNGQRITVVQIQSR